MCRRKSDPSGTSDLEVRIEKHDPAEVSYVYVYIYIRTDNVEDPEELAEEISVSPKVVVLQVCVEIVDQQLLLLPLLRLRDDALVEIHLERRDLSRLPVFPQPSWNIE